MKLPIFILAIFLPFITNAKVHDDIVQNHRVVHCKTDKANDNVLVPRMGVAVDISQYGDTTGSVIVRYSDVLRTYVGPFPKGSKLLMRLKNGDVIKSASKKDALWNASYKTHKDNSTDKFYSEDTDVIIVFTIQYDELKRLVDEGLIKMRITYDDQYKDYIFENGDFDKAKSLFSKQYKEIKAQLEKENSLFIVREMEDF